MFEGNAYDAPLLSKKNYLTNDEFLASLIRIWPVQSIGNCTQIKLYGGQGSGQGSGEGQSRNLNGS